MKRVLLSVIALVTLVTGSWIWQNGFQGALAHLEDQSQQALDALAREDYEQAEDTMQEVSSQFELLEEKWTIVINHNLLDEISNQTTEVRALLEQEEYPHAAAQLAVVKALFHDLSDQYKISIGNIF